MLDLAQWGSPSSSSSSESTSISRVRSQGRIGVAVGTIQATLVGAIGVGAGLAFGLGRLDAVYFGVAAALSSSLVATSYLDETGPFRPTHERLAESIHFTEDVLGVLVVLSLSAFVYAATPAPEQFAVAGYSRSHSGFVTSSFTG